MSLSEQQFVDCVTTDVGCYQGLMDYTSVFAEKNAVCVEGSNRHTAQNGTCNLIGLPSGHSYSNSASKQPVSTVIEANQALFQLYSSGVLTMRNSSRPRYSDRREQNRRWH